MIYLITDKILIKYNSDLFVLLIEEKKTTSLDRALSFL